MALPSSGDSGSGQPRMFDLNRPQGFAKDEYLYSFTSERATVFELIRKSSNSLNHNDIILATMFAISLIAHDDLRRQQELLFHAALDYVDSTNGMPKEWLQAEIVKLCDDKILTSQQKAERITRLFNNKQMTSDQKIHESMRICAITMGGLTAYVDQFRGLAHTLKVGELVNLEKPYAKRTRAFSDDTPIEL